MKSKENLVFLGMMGSGKSSIGLIVSKKLKLNFYDVDKLIENDQKMKISKIFESKGEDFFRQIERKITLNLLRNKKGIIALGGGAFINQDIKKEVLKNHMSFWLNWEIDTLINRIKNSKKRPLAFNSSKNELVEIIKKRSTIYSKALYKINCENLSKNEIAKKIIEIYETNQINS
tara:strand:- start:153 stop:677 length:525 start_codon:yes stop_codon:yes gene_type:complete